MPRLWHLSFSISALCQRTIRWLYVNFSPPRVLSTDSKCLPFISRSSLYEMQLKKYQQNWQGATRLLHISMISSSIPFVASQDRSTLSFSTILMYLRLFTRDPYASNILMLWTLFASRGISTRKAPIVDEGHSEPRMSSLSLVNRSESSISRESVRNLGGPGGMLVDPISMAEAKLHWPTLYVGQWGCWYPCTWALKANRNWRTGL